MPMLKRKLGLQPIFDRIFHNCKTPILVWNAFQLVIFTPRFVSYRLFFRSNIDLEYLNGIIYKLSKKNEEKQTNKNEICIDYPV
jgi:hypothetical protein